MMSPSSQGKQRTRLFFGLAAGLAVLILFIGLRATKEPRLLPSRSETSTNALVRIGAPANSGGSVFSNAPRTRGSQDGQPSPRDALPQVLQEALSRLRAGTTPEESRVLLEALKQRVMTASSKPEAVEAILEFLRSGQDAATGLAFRVGPQHALAESPTLRAALLDWLGQLDPAAAAQFAEHVFQAMASPEEYALALRNFARGRPEQKDELRHYFNRMLTHAPWAGQAAAGYLESFDVVPHLGDPAFFNPLGALLSPTTQAPLRHASLVALDRLVLANPAGALAELLNGKTLDDQPLVRASFLARADLRDPGQRQFVERYLLSPTLSSRELDKFVGLFPNANRFVSYNLLTESGGGALADLAALDAAALEQVRIWQTESRFSKVQPQLARLADRLREQVNSAVRGGLLPPK